MAGLQLKIPQPASFFVSYLVNPPIQFISNSLKVSWIPPKD